MLASTAAARVRGTPLTAVNVPARYMVAPSGEKATCETAPPVTVSGQLTTDPSEVRTAARPGRATPPIDVNAPTT